MMVCHQVVAKRWANLRYCIVSGKIWHEEEKKRKCDAKKYGLARYNDYCDT